MLYSEIAAVCSQIHTKHTNALCGQNVECECQTGGRYETTWLNIQNRPVVMLESEMVKYTGAASSNTNSIKHPHTHNTATYQCHTFCSATANTLVAKGWQLLHKSVESLTPTSAELHLVTSLTNMAARTDQLRVRSNWAIYISVEYGQEGAQRVYGPPSSSARTTHFRPFVSLDNYSRLWRKVCPLTQICCLGIP
jgi:hypothetical protein